MRQRLSSEPDRYRGRRRVPTPPRSRYAAVVTSAFVGAGVVALGSATQMPDVKAPNPEVLKNLQEAAVAQDALADRATDPGDRASRGDDRSADAAAPTQEELEQEAWVLPLEDYTFSAPYGMRFGVLHEGIDLAAPEGTPFKAIHGGTVKQAGYNGGYGYSVTVELEDGTQMIYGHARRVLVRTGDTIKAGQILGEVGSTGHSFGTHLHVGVYVAGAPTDPVPYLRSHGVDIKLKIESVYGSLAAS
ncbi:M23 family metallopeptidase [Actinoplanes sp. TFC3]|uniref:M23 family metallopeptidase n=1 Tax=Actinoplanes sp. TFC3 TaxID=1710355 RepID=UPI00082DE917|nr:M23 family metallopeptidase [Actinoplanes sp. TFC3]